jgi:uracil-DNA glycosylase
VTFYIVGEALSKQGNGRPLSGPSGDRLSELCGVSTADLRRLFVLHNLCAGYEWSKTQARREADMLLRGSGRGDVFLLLGRKVEGCFSREQHQFFHIWQVGTYVAQLVTTPHPSGLNHWWNEPQNARLAMAFWMEQTDIVRDGYTEGRG